MEINLRKANAIQAEIRKAIAAVKLEATVSVNEYTQNLAEALIGASVTYTNAVDRKIALTTALYNIRNSVATANSTAGINILLGEIESLDQVMAIHSNVSVQTVAKSLAEVTARVEKLKAAPQDARSSIYGERFNTVETSVVTSSS